MVAAWPHAALRWCHYVLPFVEHRHHSLHAATVGSQRVKRGRNVNAVGRARLVVRVIEYPGNMHQRGTHSPSMTEAVQATSPEDA